MSEKDPNLEWSIDISDLSSISLDDESLESIDVNDTQNSLGNLDNLKESSTDGNNLDSDNSNQTSGVIDESLFLETWEERKKNVLKDDDKFWSYLRWFFFSALLTLLWIWAIVILYSFNTYIKQFSKSSVDSNYQEYVETYKEKYKRIKNLMWIQ